MPPIFTTILAEHLARAPAFPAREAHGRRAGRCRARSTSRPADATCGSCGATGAPCDRARRRPAGEFLPARGRSAVRHGRRSLGPRRLARHPDRHGLATARNGAGALVAAGGAVIAQDEATSAVWGMPGAVAHAGPSPAVLPLDEIGPGAARLFTGQRRMTDARFRLPAQLPASSAPASPLRREKRYLVESRLARSAAGAASRRCATWCGALKVARDSGARARRGRGDDHQRDLLLPRPAPFDLFRDVLLPSCSRAGARQRRMRIWCAASSTGQEPYSLAMILQETGRASPAGTSRSSPPTSRPRCSRRRKPALYSHFEVQRGLPIQMLLKYFTQVGEQLADRAGDPRAWSISASSTC